MHINQWKIVPALVAGVVVAGGCAHTRSDRTPEPAGMVLADSRVHQPGTCRRDAGRGPRDFLVTIHAGPSGTPLLKEGSKVIAPGEVPMFRVLGRGALSGKVRIRFGGQVDAYDNPIVDKRGRYVVETPFVAGDEKVFDFEVEVDKMGNQRSDGSGATNAVRARTMCDEVCTYERPCKYSIIYLPDNGNQHPELDPYTIIH